MTHAGEGQRVIDKGNFKTMINQRAQFSSAEELAALLQNARRNGNGWMASCPCHSDRTPSLSIHDGVKTVVVKCFAKQCSFGDIMRAINGEIFSDPYGSTDIARGKSTTERDLLMQEKALRIWRESLPICVGDAAWKYLNQTRRLGIEEVPSSIRLHPRLGYWECFGEDDWQCVGEYPCMVSAFSDIDGNITAIHRTYITADGEKAFDKESNRDSRKTLGTINGASIKLFPASDRLGIAEGIETAFAAASLFNVPTWAAYSASNMQHVVIPEMVSEIVIFADNDQNKAGEIAANKLATRLVAEGRKVKVLAPDSPGMDWADVLLGETQNAY